MTTITVSRALAEAEDLKQRNIIGIYPLSVVALADEVQRLRAALAQQAEPVGWRPIETAPKDGTKVLVVNDGGAVDVAGYVEQWTERDEFVRKAKDGEVYRVVREETGYWDTVVAYGPTHWQHLPNPPESSNG